MLLRAQLISLNTHLTQRGQRLYAVFESPDGDQVGLWTLADHPSLARSQVGDYVWFEQDERGSLHLARPARQQGFLNGVRSLLSS
jgi:hypothetical protein